MVFQWIKEFLSNRTKLELASLVIGVIIGVTSVATNYYFKESIEDIVKANMELVEKMNLRVQNDKR